jgi:hypothetical protein
MKRDHESMTEFPKGLNNCFEPGLVEQRLIALGVSPDTGEPLETETIQTPPVGHRFGRIIGRLLSSAAERDESIV